MTRPNAYTVSRPPRCPAKGWCRRRPAAASGLSPDARRMLRVIDELPEDEEAASRIPVMAVDSRVLELLDELGNSGCTPEEVFTACPELLPEVRQRAATRCAPSRQTSMRCFQRRSPDQASPRYRPEDTAAHSNLGYAFYAKGRLDEAIDHLHESIRLDPRSTPMAQNNLAYALAAKGQSEEAIGHYQQALRLDTGFVLAQTNLSQTLYDAACTAVQRTPGKGSQQERIGQPDGAGRRRQALDWLRANLELTTKLRNDGRTVAWLDQYHEGIPAHAEQEFRLDPHNSLRGARSAPRSGSAIPSKGPRSGTGDTERGAQE